MSDSDNEANPYAPPETVGESIPSSKPRGILPVVFAGLASLCYIGFTILLLRSTGPDVVAGKLFLFNVPVFLFWLVSAVRLRHFVLISGLATVFVQGVIMAIMFFTGFGDKSGVVEVNGVIILILLVLVWLSQLTTKKEPK